MNLDPTLHIRLPNSNDIPYIYSTWLKNYHYDSALCKECTDSVFFKEYREVIDTILEKSNTVVAVASLENDPAIIFGYIVAEVEPTPCIHYIFIKEDFRQLGIAKALINYLSLNTQKSLTFTHKTSYIHEIIKKYPNLIYNPFKLFSKGVING